MKPDTQRVLDLLMGAMTKAKYGDDLIALSKEWRELKGLTKKKEPRLKKKHDNLLGKI